MRRGPCCSGVGHAGSAGNAAAQVVPPDLSAGIASLAGEQAGLQGQQGKRVARLTGGDMAGREFPRYWPVSPSRPEARSTQSTAQAHCRTWASSCSKRCFSVEALPEGRGLSPMPSSASIHRSCGPRSAGASCSHCAPACLALSREICASEGSSAGARTSLTMIRTWGSMVLSCAAASKPSPPLLPGPQAIQIRCAWGLLPAPVWRWQGLHAPSVGGEAGVWRNPARSGAWRRR